MAERVRRPERELIAKLSPGIKKFFGLCSPELLAKVGKWLATKRRSTENEERLAVFGAMFFAWVHGWLPPQVPINLEDLDSFRADPVSEPLVAEHLAKARRRKVN